MRLLLTLFTCLAALVQLSTANFDVYASRLWSNSGGRLGYTIFDSDPNCNQAVTTPFYPKVDDASGSRTGVRCVGNGCDIGRDPIGIDVMEMHFRNNPLYHWTIYKNRGHPYKMYGLDGNVYGECILFPSNSFYCGTLGVFEGTRLLRCITRFTAKQING